MTDTGQGQRRQRFFISYAGADLAWAKWVAWHLEDKGHQAGIDQNWRTGVDFVDCINDELEQADAMLALFSPSYFEEERWTNEEWKAAVGRRKPFIPLVVEPIAETDVPAFIATRTRKTLHGRDEEAAVQALWEALDGERQADGRPVFPGNVALPEPPVEPLGPKPPLPSGPGETQVSNVSRRRNPDFSGREAQLTQLRDDLAGGRHTAVALHGMGGIGKSQIALEYVYRYADAYDLVWWIGAEQADQIPVHYTELADRLGIAVKEAGVEHNARTLLTELRGRERWLIVLDNAEDPGQIERWLPEGTGHVLITSRNPDWRRLARPLALDVFTRPDSLTYLRTRVSGITEPEADVLADELGDLPLALAQAADMVERGTHVGLYLRLLRASTSPVLREGEVPDYPEPLAGAVVIAAGNLAEEHPDAAALLRLAAFLGPDPIPTEWLIDARAELSTIPAHSDELAWMKAVLEPLRRSSLVRIDGRTFQVHRLTQAVLRDQADPEQAAAISGDVAAVLAAVTPGDPEAPAAWPAWASLTSHLGSRHIDVAHRPELRPLLCDAVHFLIRSAQPKAAAELAATLRGVWTVQLGPEHPDVLTCAQYLGHATADLGDLLGARPIIEDTYLRRRRAQGDDHLDTLKSANDLAVIHSSLGAPNEALIIDQDTLARRRRLLGDNHPDTLQSASNLASVLYRTGELVKARELEEDTLARRRRFHGEDHPETLRSAIQLAESYIQLGQTSEAYRLYEETTERCRSTLGNDHPMTLRGARGLANTLRVMGRYDEARTMIEDVCARSRRTHGDDHPDTTRATYMLACVLYHVGENEEACRLLEDVIAVERRVLGPDHRETLLSMNQLSVSLLELRRFTEARRMLEDTYARRQRAYGDDDYETLRSASNLAVLLYETRAVKEAVALLEDVLPRLRRVVGEDHEDTQVTLRTLATAYKRMGLHRKAQKLTAKKATKPGFRRKGR